MAENDPWNVTQEEVDKAFSNTSKTENYPKENAVSAKSKEDTELGVISLTCGILSFFAGFPFSVLGIVLGVLQNKKKKTGCAKGGIVCSIISLVLVPLLCLFCFLALLTIPGLLSELAGAETYLNFF